MEAKQEKGKVRGPTRKTDVLGTPAATSDGANDRPKCRTHANPVLAKIKGPVSWNSRARLVGSAQRAGIHCQDE